MTQQKLKNMRLFCGSSHPQLGQDIASELGIELAKVELSTFSCGEDYARIKESIRGIDAYIIQTITTTPNDDYMKLFLMLDALKRSSASNIHVIVPHFGYARQDKKSAPREPISSRLMADLLQAVGIDRLISMDLHSDQIQGFFNCPVDHLTALPLFVEYFKNLNLENAVVSSTDTGGAKFAKHFADRLGVDLVIIHKSRPNHNISEVVKVVGDVQGKNVIMVDDMIDTGGSVIGGLKALKKMGANSVYLTATHPVFSGPAVERLSNAEFEKVVVTDTMPLPPEKVFDTLEVISIAPLLAESIKRNYENQSISSLFD